MSRVWSKKGYKPAYKHARDEVFGYFELLLATNCDALSAVDVALAPGEKGVLERTALYIHALICRMIVPLRGRGLCM
ncbi:hypothetical protein L1987_17986 [Smallanthus sonchifolius]|uniref:Uncharacterized protein n=1 Tax=Smallanthus sonchifolius TaxID=185202 RepID=A0ACB9J0K0_9ASTR|nr:hypothetical protein L1987_17986 [Smallanthus sonchifolius]